MVTPDAAEFHSTLTSIEREIVKDQKTSENYKEILCLESYFCHFTMQNPSISFESKRFLHADVLKVISVCSLEIADPAVSTLFLVLGQCFIPVIQHGLSTWDKPH